MKKHQVTLLFGLFVVISVIFLHTIASDVTAEAYDRTISYISPTPTPQCCVEQDELLSVYTEVLKNAQESINQIELTSKTTIENLNETSTSIIENIERTNKYVYTIGTIIFGILTIEGLGGVWLIQKAREYSIEAKENAHSANSKVSKINRKVSKISEKYKLIQPKTKELEGKTKHISTMLSDLEWYKQLMLIHEIEINAIRLTNDIEADDAIRSLKEQLNQASSINTDPVARMAVLDALLSYIELKDEIPRNIKEQIETMLSSLIQEENDNVIKSKALKALHSISIDSTKQNHILS